ncbi:MAG: NAD(P)-dependent oxidoreductase [Pelagibacterales bacterium]|nr:NAD(P)-dependent oxidoreductase [Pelagibacterales bacterium]
MKKKILVLGSSGQIGLHLCNYLENKKYLVKKFDICEDKKFDLRKYNNILLEKSIKQCDYIFFLAFDVGGSRYIKEFQSSYEFSMNNLKIMVNTFNLLAKYKKPFLFASSQMSNMSYSNYGLLKLLGERISNQLNGNFVKFWNVYGIEKDLDKSHVITDFILMALKYKKIKMLTTGKESREFLHADDCSVGLEVIMKNHKQFKNQNNELHLTTGKRITILNIAKIIKKISKSKNLNIQIIEGKKKDTLQLNKKNKFNNYLNKFWKPKISINLGIEDVYQYYQNNLNKMKK